MPMEPEEAAWNATTIADFREHSGQITIGRLAGANVLLLTALGAKTGRPQTLPLGYSMDGDRYVVVGSNSGGPKDPAWVRNVQVNPVATVEVGNTRFEARATVHEGQEWRRLLDSHIAAIPFFATHEQTVDRALPVVTLEPLG